MVTAEGKFPKIGNDPLYASEVNGFNNATVIGAIFNAQVGSSTDFQAAGSIFIPKDTFKTSRGLFKFAYGTGTGQEQLGISGTDIGTNYTFDIGNSTTDQPIFGEAHILVDKTSAGTAFSQGHRRTDDTIDTATTMNVSVDVSTPAINPGSEFVVFFNFKHEAGGNEGYRTAQAMFFPGSRF